MPHGTPDWRINWTPRTVWGLEDLGEHAVRMGSPHLWDRRGDVFYETDFRDGLGIFRPSFDGLGASVILHAGNARHGAFDVKLTPGSNLGRTAGLAAYMPIPRRTGVGLEFTFSTDDDHTTWAWELETRIGTDRWRAVIHYDVALTRLQYLGDDGLYHTFATAVPYWDCTDLSNTGKMVVDSRTWNYVRFLLNDQEYSLINTPVDHIPALAGTYFQVSFGLYGPPGLNVSGYVDSVIVTQNEPI